MVQRPGEWRISCGVRRPPSRQTSRPPRRDCFMRMLGSHPRAIAKYALRAPPGPWKPHRGPSGDRLPPILRGSLEPCRYRTAAGASLDNPVAPRDKPDNCFDKPVFHVWIVARKPLRPEALTDREVQFVSLEVQVDFVGQAGLHRDFHIDVNVVSWCLEKLQACARGVDGGERTPGNLDIVSVGHRRLANRA